MNHIVVIVILVILPIIDACMRVNPVDPGMPACVGCKCCSRALITFPTDAPQHQKLNSDTTVTTGACAVRTFTCINPRGNGGAPIEVNGGQRTPGGGDVPGVEPNSPEVVLTLTCNAAGTAWIYKNEKITKVECTYSPF